MMTSYFNLLKYAATGIASPDMTYFDKMRASTLMGGVVKTLTGQPPLTFKADGTPLISWSMKGNGEQTGTPTPDNPVMPEFVGTLDDSEWTIPITCAEQTMTVNLGQTQTVRRVKKLVLDGTEDWAATGSSTHSWRVVVPSIVKPSSNAIIANIISTHYKAITFNESYSGFPTGVGVPASSNWIDICDRSISTVADFKSYLAQQYAAGHPVTVWYVLATEQTATVNEPLCKIGDYADTLTTDTPIPTAKGSNTLTVDTTVQPSEVSITGNIKPTT